MCVGSETFLTKHNVDDSIENKIRTTKFQLVEQKFIGCNNINYMNT